MARCEEKTVYVNGKAYLVAFHNSGGTSAGTSAKDLLYDIEKIVNVRSMIRIPMSSITAQNVATELAKVLGGET
jgi:hypothetical protein